ncbi:hypothetical protein ZWY2020_014065 [Hordeum vulgare]|nr:hypothetical protein ZWY2020_014065 [Hordeum vulgare]
MHSEPAATARASRDFGPGHRAELMRARPAHEQQSHRVERTRSPPEPPAHHLFDETPLTSDPMAEASDDASIEDKISALPDGSSSMSYPPVLTRGCADMRAVTALAIPLAVGVLHRHLKEFRLEYSLTVGDTVDISANSDHANLWIAHALQYKAQTVKIGFFERLGKGCPALEYLFLLNCGIKDLDIFSNTLKVLILADIMVSHDDPVSISAPSLISLSVEECPFGASLPILKNMSSLETASVLFLEGNTNCDADGIRQFLGGLSGVRSLDFYYGDTQLEMENNHGWCPTFSNLTNLTLDSWCVHADLYALIVFLQNSPNLKKLTLKLNEPRYHTGVVSAIIGELEDRSFTCEQLEIVEIICSEGNALLPGVNQFLLEECGIRPDQMRVNHQN